MDFRPRLLSVDGVHRQCLQPVEIASLSREVVAHECLLICRLVGLRVCAHGARLWVIVRRVRVQVVQIFGSVFADAQIPDSPRSTATRCPHPLFQLIETCRLKG